MFFRVIWIAVLGAALSVNAAQLAVSEEITGGLPTVIDSAIAAPQCFQINSQGDYDPVAEFTTLPRGTQVVFALPLSALPANLQSGDVTFNRGDWSLGKPRWIPERQRWELAMVVGATVEHTAIVDPAAGDGNFDGTWTAEGTTYARPPGWEFFNAWKATGATLPITDNGVYWQYDGDEFVRLEKTPGGYNSGFCLKLINQLPDTSWLWGADYPYLTMSTLGGRTWLFRPYDEIDYLYARIQLKAKPVANTISSTLDVGTQGTTWMQCQATGGKLVGATDWRQYSFSGKLNRTSTESPLYYGRSGEVINIAPSYRGAAWLIDDIDIRAVRPEGAFYVQVRIPGATSATYSALFLAGNRMETADELPVRPAHFFGQVRPVEFVEQGGRTTGQLPALTVPADLSPYTSTTNAPELRNHYALDQLVERYARDPLALANYVYNEIKLTDPYGFNGEAGNSTNSYMFWGDGLRRSALGTYLEGRGSPIEQCALLIYLLRRCGVPAAYAWTNDEKGLKLSRDYVSLMIGTDLAELGDFKLDANAKLAMRYPWVVAYIPKVGGGYAPVRLFPWLKDVELRQGLNMWDYLPQSLSTGRKINEYFFRNGADLNLSLLKSDMPTEILPNFLQRKIKEQYPQLSLSDFGINRVERKHYFSDWGAFPAPQLDDLNLTLWPDLRQQNGLWYNIAQIEVVDASNPANKITTGRMPWCDLLDRRIYLERNFAGVANSHMLYLGPVDYTLEKFYRGSDKLSPYYPGALSATGYDFAADANNAYTNFVMPFSASGVLSAVNINVLVKAETSRFAAQRLLDTGVALNLVDTAAPRTISNIKWCDHKDLLDGYVKVNPLSGFPYKAVDLTWASNKYRDQISINAGFGSAAMTSIAMDEFRYFDSIKAAFTEQATPVPSSDSAFYPAWRDGIVSHVLSRLYGDRILSSSTFCFTVGNNPMGYPGEWRVGSFGFQKTGSLMYPLVDIRYANPWTGVYVSNVDGYSYFAVAGREYNRRDIFNSIELDWLTGSAAEHDVIRQMFQDSDVVSTVSLFQRAVAEPDNGVIPLTYANYRNYQALITYFSPTIWTDIDTVFKQYPDTKVFIPKKKINGTAWANYGWWESAPSGGFGAYIIQSSSARDSGPVINAPVTGAPAGGGDAGFVINGGSGTPVSLTTPTITGFLQTIGSAIGNAVKSLFNGSSGSTTAPSQITAVVNATASVDLAFSSKIVAAENQVANPTTTASAGIGATKAFEKGASNFGALTFFILPQDSFGDPIDVTTGALLVNDTDISLNGPIALTFGRNYNSFNLQRSAFGYGWSFNLKPYLVSASDTDERFYVALPDGNEYLFRQVSGTTTQWKALPADNPDAINPNGSLFASNIFEASLIKSTSAANTTIYTLKLQNGYRLIYETAQFPLKNPDGSTYVTRQRPYLRVIEDPVGNRLQLFYHGDRLANNGDINYSLRADGWLAYTYAPATDPICLSNAYGEVRLIRSTNGQFVSFDYTANGFLNSLQTGDGRTVRYEYDGFGDLRAVVRPDGTRQSFEYVLPTTGNFSTHLLRRINDPDGRVLVNAYANTDSPAYRDYDNRPDYLPATAVPADADYFDRANRRVLQQWATTGSNLLPVRIASNRYFDTDADGVIDLTQVYDTFNQPSASPATDTYQSPVGSRPTTYKHSKGMITSITDTLGQTITQEWYATTDTPNGAYAKSMKNRTDKRGLKTAYLYDALGRVITQTTTGQLTDAAATATTRTTQTWYNANNLPLVVRSTAAALTANDTPADLIVSYTYNGYVSGGTTIGAGFLADTETTRVGGTVSVAGDGTASVSGGTVVSFRKLEFESATATSPFLYQTASAQGLLQRARVAGSDSSSEPAFYTTYVNTPQSFVSQVRTHALAGTVGGAPATDPADRVHTLRYNIRNELISETEGTRSRRGLTYDAAGRPQRVESYGLSGSTETLLANRSTYYTDNGEAAWTDGPRSGAAEDYVFADYDGAGRVIAQVVWRSEAKPDGTGVQQVTDAQVSLAPMALTRHIYDAFGNCVKTIDPEGNYVLKSYDAIGQPTRQEFFDGETNRSLGWVAFDYKTASGQYEGGGQPVTVTTSGGLVTRYTYTQEGKKLSETRPDGTVTRWTYFADGRVRTQTQPNGTTLTSSYDDTARTTTVTTRDAAGTLLATDFAQTDFRGLTLEKRHTEANQPTVAATTAYDALGRPLLVTGPAGATATATSGSSATATKAYRYAADGSWNMVAIPATFSGTTVTGYEVTVTALDALDRTTSVKTYYVTGSIPNAPPTGTPLNQVSYTYDPTHQFVTETRGDSTATGHRTRTTTYTDTTGQPVLTQLYSSDTAIEAKTRVVYDRAGRPLQSIDPLGQITTTTYDGLGRPVLSRLPDGAETRLAYDTGGHLLSRLMPGGLRWQAGYDSAGRKAWEQLLGTDGRPTRRLKFDYYSANTAAPGQPLRVLDELRGVATTFDAYDARGRLLAESTTVNAALSPQLAATRRTYTYGGLTGGLQQLALSYPGNEHPATTVAYTQDGAGQLLRETTTLDNATYADWSQSWDAAGRRTALQLSGLSSGYTNSYTYPGGNQRAVAFQLGDQSRTVGYDAQGAVSTTAGSGVFATTQSYDWRGRLTQQNHTYAGSGTALAHYQQTLGYRLDGTLQTLTRTAQGTGATSQTQTYTYNPRGQLTKEESYNGTHNYAFDTAKLGVRTGYDGPGYSTVQPDRRNLGGDFDAHGRTTAEGTAPTPLPIAGTVQGTTGIELQVSTQATPGGPWTPASAPVLGTAGTADASGTAPWSLSLFLAAGSYQVEAYARDPRLGRLPLPLATRQFTIGQTSAYAGTSVVRSEYDPAGVLTRRFRADGSVQTFYWDTLGRLLRVTDLNPAGTGTQWSAHYDAVGRRLRTFVAPVTAAVVAATPTATTSSWFDPSVRYLELGAARTGFGIAYERRWKLYAADLNGAYGGLQGIGGLEGVAREAADGTLTDWTWLQDDAQGNLLGTARQTSGTWTYTASTTAVTAYGPANPVAAANASWATTAATDLAAAGFWRGYRIDPTGFYWMGARYYDPAGGRFISPDPLGHAECPDLYSFCHGDPVNKADPTGWKGQSTGPASTNSTQTGFWAGLGVNIENPGNSSLNARSRALMQSDQTSDRFEAMAYGVAGLAQTTTAALLNVFRIGIPEGVAMQKQWMANQESSGSMDGATVLMGRLGLAAIDIGSSPFALAANVDKISAVLDLPSNVGTDFGNLVYNPSFSRAADFAESATALFAVTKLATSVTIAVGAAAERTPSSIARSWQGQGNYPGVDRFKDITLKKGQIIYGGAPGQTEFYTTASALRRSGGSSEGLFKGLQVAPSDPKYTHSVTGLYRPGVTAYEVLSDIPAAFGRTLSNPAHGPGGLPQIFIENYQNALKPLYSVPLKP